MKVLVLNSGSSSVKYEVIETDDQRSIVVGMIERIGAGGAVLTQTRTQDGLQLHESAPILDHRDAVRGILELLVHPERGGLTSLDEVRAVGHRVVHGGEEFVEPTRITPEVMERIRASIALAPLHNPHNLSGIHAALERLPEVPHVAVFDTAFHATMPDRAWHYALPYVLYRRHRVRRYGFHGTSHAWVARHLGAWVDRRPQARIISIHLGNGASACAIVDGVSVDTSMGFTPLEGLVMGTRSGDVDPAVILHVMGREELTVSDATALLNKHSGLQGLSGISSDMRDLLEEEAAGSQRAALALGVYTYRIRKYIGAYAAAMGGLDAIGFTGGVGQNSAVIRARALAGLEFLGVEVDPVANEALRGGHEGTFHSGSVTLGVVRSGEEIMIALQTEDIANSG